MHVCGRSASRPFAAIALSALVVVSLALGGAARAGETKAAPATLNATVSEAQGNQWVARAGFSFEF